MRLLHSTILAVVLGVLLGFGSTLLDGLFAGVLGGSLVPILFAFGVGFAGSGYYLTNIARRRFTDADVQRVADDHAMMAVSMLYAGECAMPWRDHDGAHLCVRPEAHTGPHVCGICEEVTR